MIFLVAALLIGVPDRQPMVGLPPVYNFKTNFGQVVRVGDSIYIEGEVWFAEGVVRHDGSIYLEWSNGGNICAWKSIYRWDGHQWTGHYGTYDCTWLESNGSLGGSSYPDALREIDEQLLQD